jgi:hypothetical protein
MGEGEEAYTLLCRLILITQIENASRGDGLSLDSTMPEGCANINNMNRVETYGPREGEGHMLMEGELIESSTDHSRHQKVSVPHPIDIHWTKNDDLQWSALPRSSSFFCCRCHHTEVRGRVLTKFQEMEFTFMFILCLCERGSDW